MARFRQYLNLNVLYFSMSVILICASANGEENSTTTATTTVLPSSSSSSSPETTSTSTTTTTTTTQMPTSTSTLAALPTIATSASPILALLTPAPAKAEVPQMLGDFILAMMKKFGAAKAVEAFQSLDQLPLGLIMKILLVEVDKQMAVDIVQMQQYAQSSDKPLIQMIGKIVAGDKNVPKEVFAMDEKLMKFPWWMRIRQKMLNNLEKYVAAYSLVPVAAKSAINAANGPTSKSPSNGLESLALPKSDLTAAVAASATEAPPHNPQQVPSVDNTPSASAPVSTISGPATVPPLRISLLNPIQQQQILETLALAQAASNTNAQVQQLLQFQQQQKQATRGNPFLVG